MKTDFKFGSRTADQRRKGSQFICDNPNCDKAFHYGHDCPNHYFWQRAYKFVRWTVGHIKQEFLDVSIIKKEKEFEKKIEEFRKNGTLLDNIFIGDGTARLLAEKAVKGDKLNRAEVDALAIAYLHETQNRTAMFNNLKNYLIENFIQEK